MAIFLAAYFYGAKGGLLSGTIGSFYSAWMMHNPYILIGNAILGFFVGLFIQYNVGLFWSILLAYCIQLPWLVLTDYFLIHMPLPVLEKLILSLCLSNMIWGLTTKMMIKPIKNALKGLFKMESLILGFSRNPLEFFIAPLKPDGGLLWNALKKIKGKKDAPCMIKSLGWLRPNGSFTREG
ncbi:MAG: hypothetical protein WCW30_02800 [Candidatus Gracilibacteria bacterium]